MLDPKTQKKGFRAFAEQAKEREDRHEADAGAPIKAGQPAPNESVEAPPAKPAETPRKD